MRDVPAAGYYRPGRARNITSGGGGKLHEVTEPGGVLRLVSGGGPAGSPGLTGSWVQRPPAASATAAAIDCAVAWTGVPATRTVGVASTPSAMARAVTYGAQSR